MFTRSKSDEVKRREIEAMYDKSRRLFPDVPEITVEELEELKRKENVVVVDVRSPAEQAVSMIPDAITSGDFERNAADYEGATVVAYCTIGHRSGLFAKALNAEGRKVLNLKGAILAWTHGGGELTDAVGPTRKVHVCRRQFDLAAEGYDPVW